jgi:hypothetical protein
VNALMLGEGKVGAQSSVLPTVRRGLLRHARSLSHPLEPDQREMLGRAPAASRQPTSPGLMSGPSERLDQGFALIDDVRIHCLGAEHCILRFVHHTRGHMPRFSRLVGLPLLVSLFDRVAARNDRAIFITRMGMPGAYRPGRPFNAEQDEFLVGLPRYGNFQERGDLGLGLLRVGCRTSKQKAQSNYIQKSHGRYPPNDVTIAPASNLAPSITHIFAHYNRAATLQAISPVPLSPQPRGTRDSASPSLSLPRMARP